MSIKEEDVSLFTATEQTTTDAKPAQYTGVLATSINLLNSTLGASILTIANSFTFCGLIPSISILAVSACVSYVSASAIVKFHTITDIDSFAKISQVGLGKLGQYVTDISIMLYCYSCMTGYVVMGAEIIQSWFAIFHVNLYNARWKRYVTVLCYHFFVLFMLTLPRNMNFLSSTSIFCFIGLMLYFSGMIYKGVTILPKEGINPSVETGTFDLRIFNTLSINVLCYSLSGIVIPVIRVMAPSLHLRNVACAISYFFSFHIVFIPAVIGYLLFGAGTPTLILNAFDDHDHLFIIVRIACFVIMITSYPMMGLSLKRMYSHYFYGTDDQHLLPLKKRIICLACENLPPLLIGLFLPNARPALAIGGAIGGGMTNLFLPPLLYIKIMNKNRKQFVYWLMIIFAIIGLFLVGIATFEAVVDAIHFFKKAHSS
ncbi:Transmembrane amino acid transporter protein [Trichomonas vaginalis G3]|uniref:Transmembrane amino acid transporter protein n=1 Tax=Trichomonas vaginalis (strain ATCC PRA-98 / G3) TaxID=412133 RepID=A2DGC3_TRIV3|nr:amino acid transmembrane transporter protein [Trichomonas vaginalis G3]EAY20519.1 Transmembrane amino acid transporter protein [Trichomonas vaginalis G3]KAI5488304.1 amino acid transmembrane transporter protein [Trichomonas vaginalis G3]|eukprot:XP_001581505.1 Transmembrane amino acid transporter protein [Trichomonas vaginalis G3]